MWVCHNINLGTDYTDFFALLNNSSRKIYVNTHKNRVNPCNPCLKKK